jgi:hypothetical protein
MIWSDRGGASRHIGDRWALRCSVALREAEGAEWPIPHEKSFTLLRVIRLDDVPEVSREANRHQLENPDFLLVGVIAGARPVGVLQAADAKFAADRIKPSQVSQEIVGNLLALPDGATRRIVDDALRDLELDDVTAVRGVFVCPQSELTTYLLQRVTRGRNPTVEEREVISVPAEPETMFAGLPMSRLIGPLARIDALPVTPRRNLISAVYYFRLGCACYFLWGEGNRPLLSNRPQAEPEPGVIAAEVAARSASPESAYELVSNWAFDVEPTVQARQAVANVASLPLRMRDVRARVEQAGRADEPGFMRYLRRELELSFRDRLLELTGEISADDPRSLPAILDQVAKAARDLRPEMRVLLERLLVDPMPPRGPGIDVSPRSVESG